MNKNFTKLMVAGLACLALCGTTFAAPHGNGGHAPKKPAVHQKAPAHHATPKHHDAPKPAHYAHHHARHHHLAPPPPPPPPPPPVEVHHEGCGLGVLVGAAVGGLLSAVL